MCIPRSPRWLVCMTLCLWGWSITGAVVILPGGAPRLYRGPSGATSMEDFYRRSAPDEFVNGSNDLQVLMAVYDDNTFQDVDQVLPSSESFVRGALQAWAEHLHLVLRPDEVWFTILSQLFFYVHAHENETASIYQSPPPGTEPMTLTDFEWFRVIQDFKYEAEGRCKAHWLMLWAMPNFTTSGVIDEMTSTVLMLGENKARLLPASNQTIACGLPSVTLQGEADDWVQLLQKLDRLPLFGPESAAYKARLIPILRRFIDSFALPDSRDIRAFWNQMVTATGPAPVCSAATTRRSVSGWLSGFFYWDAEGKPFARENSSVSKPVSTVVLDNVSYPSLAIDSLPIAYARAPFILRGFNNTERFEAYVLAGTLGKQISPGAPDGYAEALQRANQTSLLASVNSTSLHSALLPLSAWMLYGPADFEAPERLWVPGPELADLAVVLVENTTSSADGINSSCFVGNTRR